MHQSWNFPIHPSQIKNSNWKLGLGDFCLLIANMLIIAGMIGLSIKLCNREKSIETIVWHGYEISGVLAFWKL